MSTARTISTRQKPTEFADDGMPLCRWCGAKLKHKRLRYCPVDAEGKRACLFEWKIRSNTAFMRAEVLKRDKGICAICKADTLKIRRILDGLRYGFGRSWEASGRGANQEAWRWYANNHLQLWSRAYCSDLWDADHIKPVSEGGGLCGLENIRTLCIPCHKDVTREMHRRRKLERTRQPLLDVCEPNRALESA